MKDLKEIASAIEMKSTSDHSFIGPTIFLNYDL